MEKTELTDTINSEDSTGSLPSSIEKQIIFCNDNLFNNRINIPGDYENNKKKHRQIVQHKDWNNYCTLSTNKEPNFDHPMIQYMIQLKISSYKYQDQLKKRNYRDHFVEPDDVVKLAKKQNYQCIFCKVIMLFDYKIAYDPNQWTLDRIDNKYGHVKNNIQMACLKCNLKRGRTRSDKFSFTKNLQVIKLNEDGQEKHN